MRAKGKGLRFFDTVDCCGYTMIWGKAGFLMLEDGGCSSCTGISHSYSGLESGVQYH